MEKGETELTLINKSKKEKADQDSFELVEWDEVIEAESEWDDCGKDTGCDREDVDHNNEEEEVEEIEGDNDDDEEEEEEENDEEEECDIGMADSELDHYISKTGKIASVLHNIFQILTCYPGCSFVLTPIIYRLGRTMPETCCVAF